MPKQKVLLRLPYYNKLKNIIEAFLIAQIICSKEEILETTYSCYKDMPAYDYSNWIIDLSDMVTVQSLTSNYAKMHAKLPSVMHFCYRIMFYDQNSKCFGLPLNSNSQTINH